MNVNRSNLRADKTLEQNSTKQNKLGTHRSIVSFESINKKIKRRKITLVT